MALPRTMAEKIITPTGSWEQCEVTRKSNGTRSDHVFEGGESKRGDAEGESNRGDGAPWHPSYGPDGAQGAWWLPEASGVPKCALEKSSACP